MQVHQLHIKRFRCFENLELTFKEPMTLITGPNGSGKTSIMEALHYLCYLRSFRTSSPRHLLRFDCSSFFLKARMRDSFAHECELQAGFSDGKRLIKINNKNVRNYKELVENYRVVTITEDDLQLVKGAPEERRGFLDQLLSLYDNDIITVFRQYRHILQNRNKLLQMQQNQDKHLHHFWTKQLWDKSQIIRRERRAVLNILSQNTNNLLQNNFKEHISIKLSYAIKRTEKTEIDDFEKFYEKHHETWLREKKIGRSLIGSHLDDFHVEFQDKATRTYASRGQQKLTVLLIKIAQLQDLTQRKGPCLLLLDDFMTDFDQSRCEILLDLVKNLGAQSIFTSPAQGQLFDKHLANAGAGVIKLSNHAEFK